MYHFMQLVIILKIKCKKKCQSLINFYAAKTLGTSKTVASHAIGSPYYFF